jgi:acyl carrier protein
MNPMTVDRDEVFKVVQNCFAEALGLDDDEVTLDSTLIDDLGAESLDFLDIAFRLEEAFGIKIPRGDIQRQAEDEAAEGEQPFEVDGVLTELGLAKLREAMPEVPAENFRAGLTVREIPTLFTVETFLNLVIQLIEAKELEA